MFSILHTVGVEAPVSNVYGAISTKAGLAGWWTDKVTGDECVGSVLHFRFDDHGGNDMMIVELMCRNSHHSGAVASQSAID